MLGDLNPERIEELLRTQLVGRLGCHADGLTFVVPLHYAYEPPYIYAHSAIGLKLNLMRKNPEVCFEIDVIGDYFNWQSVICWGTFEEINDMAESTRAMQLITNRIEPHLSKVEDAHPSHGIAEKASDLVEKKAVVVYRIKLHVKTGKFEHQELGQREGQEN